MSSKGILADREKALEDLFFDKENKRLAEKLRAEREAASQREALAAVTASKWCISRIVQLSFSGS